MYNSMFKVCIYIYLYVQLHVTVFRIRLVRSGPVVEDPNPIWICARCEPDTMVIRRPIYGMSRRSVLVSAVKTIRQFGSETASFHVSVRSCAFPYLSLSVYIYILHLSFHVASCHIYYQFDYLYSVSYTHLTLPTIYSV